MNNNIESKFTEAEWKELEKNAKKIENVAISICGSSGGGGSKPSTGGSDEIPPQKMILEKIK